MQNSLQRRANLSDLRKQLREVIYENKSFTFSFFQYFLLLLHHVRRDRSCGDISSYQNCKQECVEGCNCPEGQTLDASNGECIPIAQCPCVYADREYEANHREIRPSDKGQELCICISRYFKY